MTQQNIGKKLYSLCPPEVAKLIAVFALEGYDAYPVGGCVRDIVMDKSPADWDIAITATPDVTEDICHSHGLRTVPTGIKHGTVTVLLPDGNHVEVTTCRTDGEYLDSRHPQNVSFTLSIEDDLSRRDFTVNAMAAHLDLEEKTFDIIDLFGGIEDIEKKVIRTVGEPIRRFNEDALRILRAVRFASRLGFKIDGRTQLAMTECAASISSISRERVATELKQIILSDGANRGVDLLICLDLLEHALLSKFKNQQRNTDISALPPVYPMRLAALCMDISADNLSDIPSIMKMSNADRKIFNICLDSVNFTLPDAPTPFDARQFRRRHGAMASDITLFIGVMTGKNSSASALASLIKDSEIAGDCVDLAHLAINGNDILEMHNVSGETIRRILGSCLDLVVKNPLKNTKNDLLRFASEKFFL